MPKYSIKYIYFCQEQKLQSMFAVVSLRGYENGGGGEMFLYQTMLYARENGYVPIWISFADNKLVPYQKTNLYNTENEWFLEVGGGFSKDKLRMWVLILKPKMIHHQGHLRIEICEIATGLKIPIITGYHFWMGAVELNHETGNIDILDNITKHTKSSDIEVVASSKGVYPYFCSDFVKDVTQKVTGTEIKDVIYPSSIQKSQVRSKKQFVSMCSIHKLKGGDIFLYLVENALDIPLLGLRTESFSEELDLKIKEAARIRNSNPKNAKVVILDHTNDIVRAVYSKTRILLVPSLVDETFSRVTNEGLSYGIPIITTGKGFIKDMIGTAGIVINGNDAEVWLKTIRELYFNKDKLEFYRKSALNRYQAYSESSTRHKWKSLMYRCISKKRIAFFVPWCDQGLGIQARAYVRALKDTKELPRRVHVFSYKPYFIDQDKKNALDFQEDKTEWICDGIPIFYSENIREDVKDDEILDFVNKYAINRFIIPETCWKRVFEIARLLKNNGVEVYAIPNIETVRKDELYKHRIFDKILCNNELCYNNFHNKGFRNLYEIGFALPPVAVTARTVGCLRSRGKPIKFLSVGGMNAFTRKQIPEVIEAFIKSGSILLPQV